MPYVLTDALSPEPGESLSGLIVRNAATYGFTDPRRLLTRLDVTTGKLWTLGVADPDGDFGLSLRTLLGLSEPDFKAMSPWTGDVTTWSVLGHPMWRDLVRPDLRLACPTCIAEAPFHRSIWNLDAMPVCAIHGAWLRRACHECDAPLTWVAQEVHRCSRFPSCMAEIADAPAEEAPAGVLGGIRALHALITGTGVQPQTPPGMQPQDALRLSFVLGQLAFGFERDTRPRGFIEAHHEQLPEILDAGWSALADWPNGFYRFLDRLRARAAGRTGKDGLRKAFGSLSSRVYDWAREPRGAFIGEAFANYAAGQGDLATTAHTLSRYAPGAEIRHRFITMAEAQKVLGISASSIDRLATRRNLYVLPPRGAGLPALMRADVFLAPQDGIRGLPAARGDTAPARRRPEDHGPVGGERADPAATGRPTGAGDQTVPAIRCHGVRGSLRWPGAHHLQGGGR